MKHLGPEAGCEISLSAELSLIVRLNVVQISQHFGLKWWKWVLQNYL